MSYKKTVQELASGDTTTASTGISSVQGELWLKEILEFAKHLLVYEQFAKVADLAPGNNVFHMPVATANIDFDITSAEGTGRTMTQIDNLSTVDFTPATQRFGVAVARDVVRTSQVDVLTFAREQLGYDAALNIEDALVSAINGATPAADLFGGAATTRATLTAGDVLSTTLLNQAQRALKSQGWMSEPDRPFVALMAAEQEEALMEDTQFVDASQYGTNEVVMNGEIGRYLGLRIVISNRTTSFADGGAGGNLDGHYVYVLKAKVAYGIVYGERPFLDFEYEKNEAEHRIYLDMSYAADSLQDAAIVHMQVLDV